MARDLHGAAVPCPVCGRDIDTKNGRLIYHDKKPPMREVCSGSKAEVLSTEGTVTPIK